MKKINFLKQIFFTLLALVCMSTSLFAQLPYNTTMTQTHYNNSKVVVSSSRASWSNGVYLNRNGFNWDDKYVVIALNQQSIPYQLKFKYKCSSGAATNPDWYVAESSDNKNWTSIWSTESNSTSASSEQVVNLSKSTKYIKLCYSGNFGGTFSNIKVTDQAYVHNPTVNEESISELDFGTGTISSGEETLTFDVEWCNVNTMNVTCDNTTYFTVSPASFGKKVAYATQTITVKYNRDKTIGKHSGTISISNGTSTYNKSVTVKGETTKRSQEITWNAALEATNFTLNAEDALTGDEIATTNNEEAEVTFSSSAEEIITVSPDGKTLYAIANGTAEITASAPENDIYSAGLAKKTFTVTSKKKQVITWEQSLMGLKTNANPKAMALTATATSGGVVQYAIEGGTASCITLSGENNATLTITGTPGEAYIIATQAGGIIGEEEWISATMRKHVKVRDPNSLCDEYALADESFTFNSGDKTSMATKEFSLTGKPTTLTFYAKRGGLKFAWSEQKPLIVEQYANSGAGLEWQQVASIMVTESNTKYTYPLEESATKIRFRTGEYAKHEVTNISTPRKKEFIVSETDITENAERNVKWTKQVSVTRSNVDAVDITVESDDAECPFTVSKSTIGTDCEDRTTETFDINITPREKNATYTGRVILSDNKSTPTTHTINLSITAVAFNQTIDNFDLPATCSTTETVELAATASSHLDVVYISSDSTIAYVEDNHLVILTSGAVDITAYQEGSDKYNEASLTKKITISKDPLTIAENPTASSISYGQKLSASTFTGGKVVRQDGTEVEGTFAWADGDITPDAGTREYNIVFTPNKLAWYDKKNGSVSVTISKVDPEVTAPVAASLLVYDGTEQTLVDAGYVIGGTMEYSLDNVNFDETEPSAVNAGDYTVYYRVIVDANHNEALGGTVAVNIAKADAALTVPTAVTNLVYTGEAHTLIVAGAAQGGTIEYSLDGENWSAELPSATEAGDYTVQYRITPDANHNAVEGGNVAVNIAKVAASVTAPEAVANLVYTGEELTLIVAGEVQGGTIEYSLDGENWSAELPSATEAGDYTVQYRITPDANHNAVEGGNVVVNIAKADASAVAPEAVANLVYTGEPQTLIVAGEVQGGTIEYSLDGENWSAELPSATEAGDYTVQYRITPDANHNAVEGGNVVVNIAKADASAVAPEAVANLVYTGEPQTLIVAGSAQGGSIEYSLDGENFAAALPTGINAGDYTVSFRVVGDANHNDVAAAAISASIAKAEAALTAPTIVADLVYTGAAQALVVAGEAEGGELLYSLDGETYAAALPMGTNAGAYTIYYKVVADANHSDIAAATLANSIAKADPAIVWPTAQNICVGNQLSAAVLLGGSADVDGAFAWENGDEAFAEIGTYHRTVAFTPADALNYNGATESIEVVVGKAQPAITAWPSANGITYGQTLAEAALNNDGVAAVPGTFAWKDETFVPAAGTQQCVVVFTPNDLENYGVVNGEVSVEVAKAEAALTAPTIVADLVYTGATQALVVAGEAEGGELLYSLDGENYAAALPTGINAGAYTIYYKVAGDANHNDIAAATLSNSIAKATPTILVKPTANGIRVGDALSASLLIGGEASTNGTFAWENGAFVATEAGTHEYAVVFTPADADNFYTAAETVSVEVGKAQPAITAWPTATEITYGQLLSASSLENGAAAVEGTFAWADGSQELNAGAHTAIVVFTPNDLENYSAVNGEATVSVKKATPAINAAPTAAAITYGQTLADATLSNGEADVNGTFAWADATVAPNVGENQPFAVIFTPADADNYTTANTTALVTVGKADAAITVQPTVAPLTYGQTLADATLSYDAVAAGGTFAWAQATDEVLNAGEHQVAVLFTPADAANYNTAETTVTVTVNKAATTINVKPTATGIGYGQFLEASELVGGEATTEGTFAWANPTEMPDMGEGDFEVIFTPTDAANYLTATTTVHLVVAKGVPELYDEPTVSGNLVYGTMLADLTLVGGEAIVDGTFAWQNPTETLLGGTHEYNVVFTPDEVNQDEFDVLVFRISITAAKATPNVITWPTASAITYGQTLSEATLSTDGEADVDGTFVWQNGTSIPEQGVAECVLLFVPDNDNYKTVQQVVEVVVNAASITTGVDETEAADKAVKVLREDKLLIIRGGRTYTATGRLVE